MTRFALMWPLALAALALSCSPALASRMRWSAPRLIDHRAPFADQGFLETVACPSVSLCVAGGDAGEVATSTNPTSGSSWKVARVDAAGDYRYGGVSSISSLSCPSVSLCVGTGDQEGDVVTSTHPLGGAGTWKVTRIDPGGEQLIGVSCPTSSLCVAVNGGGRVFTTSHLTGGRRRWRSFELPGTGPVDALTCASAHLCVVVDDSGNAVTSSDPTGGTRAWHRHNIDGTQIMFSIACPSVTFCIAGDGNGQVLVSHNPTSLSAPWTAADIDGTTTINALHCRSSSQCVAVDNFGGIFTSANPGGGPAAWSSVGSDAAASDSGYDGVDCPSDSVCVAVDGSANVVSSARPLTSGTWSATAVDRSDHPTAISCPTPRLCAAVDASGNVLTSTTPGRAGSWRLAHVEADGLDSISCPSISFCLAVDSGGNTVTSTHPTGGAGAWRVTNIEPSYIAPDGETAYVQLTGVACASARLCITGDEDPGDIFTSTRPTGAGSAWHGDAGIGRRFGTDGLAGVSCPSQSLCVVVSGQAVHASTRPATAAGTSSKVPEDLGAVSCTPDALCVAVGTQSGSPWTSVNPGVRHPRWRRASAGSHSMLAVSCHARALCAATDVDGHVAVSTRPAGARPDWRLAKIDGAAILTAVACPSATECIVLDQSGRLIVGRRH